MWRRSAKTHRAVSSAALPNSRNGALCWNARSPSKRKGLRPPQTPTSFWRPPAPQSPPDDNNMFVAKGYVRKYSEGQNLYNKGLWGASGPKNEIGDGAAAPQRMVTMFSWPMAKNESNLWGRNLRSHGGLGGKCPQNEVGGLGRRQHPQWMATMRVQKPSTEKVLGRNLPTWETGGQVASRMKWGVWGAAAPQRMATIYLWPKAKYESSSLGWGNHRTRKSVGK